MSSKEPRRLVIDACVARAAGGEDAKHPVSRNCRDFLHAMIALPHKIVKTNEIWTEWRNHKSTYARVWLNRMIARKRVYFIDVVADAKLREYAVAKFQEKEAAAMLKDCHLVEAANATDQVVVSKDIAALKLFSTASNSVGWLKSIAWVNPTEQSEKAIDWLSTGAEAHESRCLHRFIT